MHQGIATREQSGDHGAQKVQAQQEILCFFYVRLRLPNAHRYFDFLIKNGYYSYSISSLELIIDATSMRFEHNNARCHHGGAEFDNHGLGGVLNRGWGQLLHGLLKVNCCDGLVCSQLHHHELINAMPWFDAVISHIYLPQKALF
jgi:hypothetical protein